MANLEVTAKFTGERFRFNNPTGDVIVGNAFNDDNFTFTIKGPADEGELVRGIEYRFFGKWVEYKGKKIGPPEKQFHFQTFVQLKPATKESIVAYIAEHGKGNGIGPGRAAKIYQTFGDDAIEVCKQDPARVVATISQITIEQANNLAAKLREDESIEKIRLDLSDLLNNRGFPKKTLKLAIVEYGNLAATVIRRNPYRLMQFPGCGFKKCDSLYIDLGLNPARLLRQALAAWYGIARDTDGHTWYPRSYAEAYIRGTISGAEVNTDRAIELAVRGKLLAEDRGHLAEYQKAKNEEFIAEAVVGSVREVPVWPDVQNVLGITEHQREQLRLATSSSIGILGGSPGTGKTWTVASLVQCLGKEFGLKHIAIGAPTGKAAVRVTENLASRGINLRARTWHSLLFSKTEDKKFFIGDETSMDDTDLMASIFRIRPTGTNVLFVGDVNQLSPVGHGAPMRDLIAAGIAYGELREIKRNSGGIVEACAAIRDNQPWQPGNNLLLHEVGQAERQIDQIFSSLQRAESEGLDRIWDCQVLVAVNERSPLSRKELNKILQAELNKSPKVGSIPFRVGDKVVNTKNGFFSLVEEANDVDVQKNEAGQCFVANGELAKVIEVNQTSFIAEIPSPKRIIRVGFAKAEEGSEEGAVSSWDLGYAISVHKSQGSDWPIVMVMIDEYPGARMVCDRSWIYTAISRAKLCCELIGKKEVADRFCDRSNIWKRKTFLKELIHKFSANEVLAGV